MRTHIIAIAAIALFSMPKMAFGQVNPSNNDKYYTASPIDLRYFSAENKDNQVSISWGLASDLIYVIELQKSFNARDFETIAVLQDYAMPEKRVYSFLDKMPFKNADNVAFNAVYYRLKQIDANHIFEYSKIIVVKETNEIGLAASTPKSYQFTPKSVATPHAFSIVNVAGQVMLNGQVKESEALDIRRLPAGFYCLNIQSIKVRFLKN
jgi:hypothetical protein